MKNTIPARAVRIFGLGAFIGSAILAAQTVEVLDGVRIVHNGKVGRWGAAPQVSIELVRKIGDVDTTDENLAFNEPGDIVEDGQGNIYVADAGNYRIQKFNKDGKFVVSLGRKGQGPGEFSSLRSLNIDAEDRLYVFDSNSRVLKVLSADGKEIKSVRFLTTFFYGLRLMKNGYFLVCEPNGGPRPLSPKILLKMIDDKAVDRGEFGLPVDFGEAITNQVGNSISTAAGPDGWVAVSFKYQNRIEKYTAGGKLVWKADRPLNFDTKVIEKGKFEMTATTTSYKTPKMNLCSNGVAVDDSGRVWTLTYSRQIKPEEEIRISQSGDRNGITTKREGNTELRTTDMYQLEVFDADGFLLGVIPLKQFVDGIWIFKDRLYLLDRDRGVSYSQFRIVTR